MVSVFDTAQFNGNLFFPRPDGSPTPPGREDIFIEVENSIQVHARRHPSREAGFGLLFFHGNGEIVADYDDLADVFNSLGGELVVSDYRGYGKSTGVPTLRDALRDTPIIYQALVEGKKLKIPAIVMGRSLGAALAIELCLQTGNLAGCVIESGYADPVPLVERRGLKVESISPEDDAMFNNSTKIAGVTCPLLIMHGADDCLISSAEAELNYQKAGSEIKELKILAGVGHNDMLASRDYFPTLKKFFDQIL